MFTNEKLKRNNFKLGRSAISNTNTITIGSIVSAFTTLKVVLELLVIFAGFQTFMFAFYVVKIDKDHTLHAHSLRQSVRTEYNPLELETWLKENGNTPAARFVQLLRMYLHDRPDAEANRIRACCNQATSFDRCADIVPIKTKQKRKVSDPQKTELGVWEEQQTTCRQKISTTSRITQMR
jgi:hypothetical protein